MNAITIIYIYRNRDTGRIRRSLDSLRNQEIDAFKVIFVDYGSDTGHRKEVQALVSEYPFCRYFYSDTRGMPWNRSHALNSGIRLCDTDYFFTADIDLVFHPDFVSCLQKQAIPGRAVFFRVYYLPDNFGDWNRMQGMSFPKSEDHALGLALLPVEAVSRIRGYDESYCYWGIEDNDMQHRLQLAGVKTEFYDAEILLYHQYHPPTVASVKTFPAGWGAFQLAYMKDRADEMVRNTASDWGIRYEEDKRNAWIRLNRQDADFPVLDCNNRFFAYKLQQIFNSTEASQPMVAAFEDTRSESYQKSKLTRVAMFLQKAYDHLGIPLESRSQYRHLYQTVYEARDQLVLFILSNRALISDFAYAVEGNRLRFVVWKA